MTGGGGYRDNGSANTDDLLPNAALSPVPSNTIISALHFQRRSAKHEKSRLP
ncbi:MAG: hypothetical protein LBR08_12710 [Bacteroidales bacterium]|jgi:hypothetical protein|nr:hypothetical protein [Bacteroidales bacterium]